MLLALYSEAVRGARFGGVHSRMVRSQLGHCRGERERSAVRGLNLFEKPPTELLQEITEVRDECTRIRITRTVCNKITKV